MPFYEYRRADGTTFEVMQRMTDPQLTEDPETGQPVQRVFHPIAVHFKGKGFYNTDYGTKNRQRETAAQQEGTSKAEAKTDGKSDAKSDAKPDGKSGSSSSGDSSSKPAKSSGSSDSKSGSQTTPDAGS